MTPGGARSPTLGKRLNFRRAVFGGRIPTLKIPEISEIFNFCVFLPAPNSDRLCSQESVRNIRALPVVLFSTIFNHSF